MSSQSTQHFKHFGQLSLLFLFWAFGLLLQRTFNLPISAGVLGLFSMLTLLLTGLLPLHWIKAGSDLILSELVLFFVPCVVGLINYQQLFIQQGWQLILAVLLGSLCVLIVTAYTVFIGFKMEAWIKAKIARPESRLLGEQ
ncbi:CidA/LrgA family protein [Acinetobacter sp. CAAS 2-6]|uniref:CidA/LrgA family protein n=1 Tax=Acinetobacter sp. CAAS 2-6 TaxID=3016358 RepID=UPI002DD689EE|nr:CidA/LrgA family protein [Acinetobacter sp. CAAS 2-6]